MIQFSRGFLECEGQNPAIFQVVCPPGFSFSYSVRPGDTMFLIAQRFGISLQQLIAANPQIANPNLIFPGEVLCVPTPLRFPCRIILGRQISPPLLPPDAQGTALAQTLTTNQHSISVLAIRLSPPASFGNFDIYEGLVNVPNIGGFGLRLFPAGDAPAVWAGTTSFPPVLTPDSTIIVRPANTQTGVSGPTVLAGDLSGC